MLGASHDWRDARRLRPKLTDIWNSDEIVVWIEAPVSLWRILDWEGEVLDLLISTERTRHRDKHLGCWMNTVLHPY